MNGSNRITLCKTNSRMILLPELLQVYFLFYLICKILKLDLNEKFNSLISLMWRCFKLTINETNDAFLLFHFFGINFES